MNDPAMPGSHTDWYAWHEVYDVPDSRFATRLAAVQTAVRRFLDSAPPGEVVVLDICGGQSRCVLPVLEDHPRAGDVRLQLVEHDPRNVAVARDEAARLGISFVERIGDGGASDTYAGLERAQLVVMSGLFIHMPPSDRRRTIGHLPEVCAADATLVWTLRAGAPARQLGRFLARGGFVHEPLDHEVREHRVGVSHLTREPRALQPGVQWFRFQSVQQTRRNKARVALGRWRRRLLRQPPVD